MPGVNLAFPVETCLLRCDATESIERKLYTSMKLLRQSEFGKRFFAEFSRGILDFPLELSIVMLRSTIQKMMDLHIRKASGSG